MESLFSAEYKYIWAAVLAVALLWPVRNLLFTLYVRRAMKHGEPDSEELSRLRRRAGATALLLCFVFAFLYTGQLFQP